MPLGQKHLTSYNVQHANVEVLIEFIKIKIFTFSHLTEVYFRN